MLTFKKKSWHYKIACKFGNFYRYDEESQNICTYTRAVTKGICAFTIALILSLLLGTLLVGFPLFFVGYTIGYMFGFLPLPDPKSDIMNVYGPGFIIFLVWIIGGIAYGVNHGWKRMKRNRVKVQKTSFIKEAYRSWKGKYCARVEFE